MGSYLRAADVDTALAALAVAPRTVLAGGTDWYPARVGQPLQREDVVDVSGLAELQGIVDAGDHWRLGALTTWSQLIATPLPACFDGYKAAAREVGGLQIQNAATLAGNLCNASPAADGTPNLLALDASVELRSASGLRTLPVAEFVVGNRRTAIAPDELLTALLVPKPPADTRSAFFKLGARRYLVISVVMLSVLLVPAADGSLAEARVAVGACSAVARRLRELEQELAGRPLDASLADVPGAQHLAPIAPIDDLRGTAAYRRDACLTLLRRALKALAAA